MDTAYSPPAYHQDNGSYIDQGAPAVTGERQPGAPSPSQDKTKAPPGQDKTKAPNYVRSVFADPAMRDLVTAACDDQAAQLRGVTDRETAIQRSSRLDAIRRLGLVADELRPETEN